MTDHPTRSGAPMRLFATSGPRLVLAALVAACLSSAAIADPPREAAGSDPVAIAAPAAAAQKGAALLTEMGKFFELSEPPSQDYVRARDLYCRAAADAHPEALQRLGWLYFKGHGVAVNEQVAGTLFRWAAELGDERSRGLSAALWSPIEAPPPCLVERGLRTVDAIRERQQRVNQPPPPPGPPPPSPVVGNPLQFRNTAPLIDQRRLVQMMVQSAREFRLDPRLVPAVMRMESNFDPLDNLRGGMAYLRWLLASFRGDVPLALAAYNAGEGADARSVC